MSARIARDGPHDAKEDPEVRCPRCSSTLTPISSEASERLPTSGPPTVATEARISCPSCGATFTVEQPKGISSVTGRMRTAKRPRGVVILNLGDSRGAAYRENLGKAEVSLHLRKRGQLAMTNPKNIGIGTAGCVVTGFMAVMIVFGIFSGQDIRESVLMSLVLVGVIVIPPTVIPLLWTAFVALRKGKPSFDGEIRLTRDALMIMQSRQETFRHDRRDLVQVACIRQDSGSESYGNPLCTLVAFSTAGVRFELLRGMPPEHGMFAELWLEEQLGIGDRFVLTEIIDHESLSQQQRVRSRLRIGT